jgi:1-acyl-sn-glycerol-3-phosphate acyltransferase
VVIFPEGGRSITGKLDSFKPGAFRIAVRCDTPAVPVTINGAYEIWPPGKILPRLSGKVIIYYHPPVYPIGKGEEDLKARTQDMLVNVRRRVISKLDPAMMPEDADTFTPQREW